MEKAKPDECPDECPMICPCCGQSWCANLDCPKRKGGRRKINMKNYVIAWRSNVTDQTGRGDTKYTKADADAICERDNIELPNIQHWAEEGDNKDAI